MTVRPPVNRAVDIAAAGLGAFVAIVAVIAVSRRFVADGAPFVVLSMGSSAVVLFGDPNGRPAQPLPVLYGHLVGALSGVASAQLFGANEYAAALAVAVTLVAMIGPRLVHPPAGATAIAGVLGGGAITDLGFGFVLAPVLLNVVLVLVVAFLVNNALPWRRYPASLLTPVTSSHERDDVRSGS